jgi:ABC-2 type transport system ATP-binding protein
VLLTLLQPTSGKLFVDGIDVVKHTEQAKRLMGLMTQETIIETELTARQNLQLFGELYHLPQEKIPKAIKLALDEADLVAFADKKAGTFSGGMQKRLGLVRAMIQEPKVLVLDEPTTGLDPQNRQSMWARIKELNKRGTTIMLTTQYLEEADVLCDRLAIIDRGKVIALGTPSEIRKIAGTGKFVEIEVKPDQVQAVVKMLKLKFRLNPEIVSAKVRATIIRDEDRVFQGIVSALAKQKISAISIGMHLPTLDDVFIKMTGATMRDTLGEDVSAVTRARVAVGR